VTRPLEDYQRLVERYWHVRAAPRAFIDTDEGTITLELFGHDAPLVVESFTRLAQSGKYRNSIFHRVVPNFVLQDGDIGNGTGEPEAPFTLRESWTRRRHERGCLGLATAGPDTGGSQFYLCHSAQPHLDGGYTVFGRVIDGFDVMDRLVQGDRMLQVRVP
jgi:cyclophilin family peptidyl-prolyl cis-trans isomerase